MARVDQEDEHHDRMMSLPERMSSMRQMAIVAPGKMGSGLARHLTGRGARVLTCLDGRSAATVARARTAGMTAGSPEDIARCEIILSVVPPAEAVAQARRLASAMESERRSPLYVDLNATSPQTSALIEAVVTQAGGRYVDGSIMGNPPAAGYAGPCLYVSGPFAREAMSLADAGLNMSLLNGPNGSASALKMAFAGVMKGLTALGAGMFLAASRAGADEALLSELRRSQPDLASWFDRQIPGMYPKTYRWVGEMREIEEFLGPDASLATAFGDFAQFFGHLSSSSKAGAASVETLQRFFPSAESSD